MPRQPALRKKTVNGHTYWFTKTGGETSFGRVDEVSLEDAQKMFATHLLKVRTEGRVINRRNLTVCDLIDHYLTWVQKKRSQATYEMRQRHCQGFANYKPGASKTRLGRLPALQVRGDDLEGWLASLDADLPADGKLEPQTKLHAETSVRACFRWGTRNPSPTTYLPPDFRPFAAVERTEVPPKVLAEEDLMKVAERQALFAAAAFDLNQFRRHGLAKTVAKNGAAGLRKYERTAGHLADLLTCFYATGARTSELLNCRVADFQPGLRQVVLGKHKRSRTQRVARHRQVTLNDEAVAVFTRHCAGKKAEEFVFLRRNGRPWNVWTAAKHFGRLKEVAAATGLGTVREEITLYDFRHLWISEALAAGNSIYAVAQMAGTSIAMIERVYGHFITRSARAAQAKLDEYRRGVDANPPT
jgi:integrase